MSETNGTTAVADGVEVEPEAGAPARQTRVQVLAPADRAGAGTTLSMVTMSDGPGMGELFAALAAAQGEFAVVEKALMAKVQSAKANYTYRYEELADVLAAVRPALSQHGLAIMQFPFTRSNSVAVKTLLGHKSGAWIANDLSASSMGTDPQAVGSAISYLRRYGLKALLGISATDDDGASASGQPKASREVEAEQAPPRPAPRKSEQRKAAAAAAAPEPAPVPGPVVPVGRIIGLAQKGTGVLVTLSSGYAASTRDPQLVEVLRKHEAAGTVIELLARPSSDPAKYAPVIEEVAAQVRET